MKTIMSIVLVFASLLSIPAYSQNTPAEYALFEKEEDRIIEQRKANKIGRTVALKETLIAAKTYMPRDRVTHDYLSSLINYSEQFDKKKISQKEYDSLREARNARFSSAIKDLNESEYQEFLKSESARQDQAAAYNEAARQQQNAVAGATMLNGIGRAFNNSFGQSITPPLQICTYYGGTRYCQ